MGEERCPGAAALVAMLRADQLFVANAGDCRAMLCRGGAALALSRDHTAALDDERQRITAAGGLVAWRVDSWRIGEAGLQVLSP